ncbi:TATA-binding protein-associated factor mot1, partial [Coemansia sp. RSA 2708]
MTTRLDRLLGLLESGATPLVRSTAARQIGGIQKQHPEELYNLLGRVYGYVGSKSWDTRVAAAQAMEAIAKEVDEWEPEAGEQEAEMDADWLTFEQFDVDAVLRNGRLLLGSAGKEYDEVKATGQERVAMQRAQIKQRLGLGAQFLDEDLLDDVDLGADDVE